MSRAVAALYTLAADALTRGNVTLAAETFVQISDDLEISHPSLSFEAYARSDALLSDGLGPDDIQRAISDARSAAHDFAETARENDR